MIGPVWQNQVWLLEVLISEPVLLPMSQHTLKNTQGDPHPLVTTGHLPLAAWPISGRASAPEDFLKSYWNPQEVMERSNRVCIQLSLEEVGQLVSCEGSTSNFSSFE